MNAKALSKRIVTALDDMKAENVRTLDVQGLTSITDVLIIASGRSDRQVRALADRTVATAKGLGITVLGTEGEQQGEWILVDLGDVVVHLMRPATRLYYQLEKLWSAGPRQASSST